MSNETDKMNYCCDCGWAIRKGFIFKKWYCTCPEIMEKLKKVEISPVNGTKTIEKKKRIECTNLRGTFAYSHLERMPDGRKFCKNYKGQLRGHPAIPPKTTPYHEAPPMPERVEKAMEEHDAAYLMNQKQKELEAENKLLKEAKEELLLILKKTCTLYNINAQCPEYVDECKHGLEHSCSVFRTIQKHDGKDGNK